jgi:hypothetical protein
MKVEIGEPAKPDLKKIERRNIGLCVLKNTHNKHTKNIYLTHIYRG